MVFLLLLVLPDGGLSAYGHSSAFGTSSCWQSYYWGSFPACALSAGGPFLLLVFLLLVVFSAGGLSAAGGALPLEVFLLLVTLPAGGLSFTGDLPAGGLSVSGPYDDSLSADGGPQY